MDCYGLSLIRSLLPHKPSARGWQRAKQLCPMTPWCGSAIARCDVQCSKNKLCREVWFVLRQSLVNCGTFHNHEEQPIVVNVLGNMCFENSALCSFVGFKCKKILHDKKEMVHIHWCTFVEALVTSRDTLGYCRGLYIKDSVER